MNPRQLVVPKAAARRRNPAIPNSVVRDSSTRLPIRDAERTKRAILKAATSEFAENGLAGARVDKIAETSLVNKRMIYYYFTARMISTWPFSKQPTPRCARPRRSSDSIMSSR